MKKSSTFFIIAILVMVLFCISAVSAADANATDDGIALESADEPVIESSADNDIQTYEETATDEIIAEDDEKIDAEMNISAPENMSAGGKYYIDIALPEDANGETTIIHTRGEDEYYDYVSIINGSCRYKFIPGDTGTYDITFKYGEDVKYNDITVVKTFEVEGYTISLENDRVATNGKYIEFQLIVPYSFTERITLTINGKEYELTPDEDGQYFFNTDYFNVGDNEVNFYFKGNDKFSEINTTANFEVYERKNFKMNVSIPEVIYAGEYCLITFQVPEDYTDYVILERYEIWDEDEGYWEDFEYIEAESGIATYNYYVSAIDSEYNFRARTYNTDIYSAQYETVRFKATDYTISLAENPMEYEEDATISLLTPGEFEGIITLTLNGKEYSADESYDISVDNLVLGENNVTIYYAGDEKFHKINKTVTLNTYTREEADIELIVPPTIIALEDTIFTIIKPENLTGNIEIYDYGHYNPDTMDEPSYLYWGELEKGTTFKFETTMYDVGNYTLRIYYSGNDDYKPLSKLVNVEVRNYTINIENDVEVTDSTDVRIEVPNSFAGDVTVTINNKSYTASSENDYIITVDNLIAGDNDVEIYYAGDEKFHEVNKTTSISTYERMDAEFEVEIPKNVSVNEQTTITIIMNEDIDEYIEILDINDEYFTDAFLEEGKGTFTVYPQSFEELTFKIRFGGNDKYRPQTKEIKIKPNGYVLTLGNEETPLTNESVNYIKIPDSFTGDITVTVNGESYTVTEETGYHFTITNLVLGENEVNIYYAGDETYKEFNRTTTLTTFEKEDLEIIIKVPEEVIINQDYAIEIEYDTEKEQYLFLSVYKKVGDNWEWYRELEVYDGSDRFIYTPTDLKTEWRFHYPGNYYYKSQDQYFTMQATGYELIFDNDRLPVDNANTYIRTPNSFTGNITVTLNGTEYTLTVDDGYAITFTNLAVGDNEVNIYAYDDTLGEYNETATVTGYERESLNISVIVPKDLKLNEECYITISFDYEKTDDIYVEILIKNENGAYQYYLGDSISLLNDGFYYTPNRQTTEFKLEFGGDDTYKPETAYFTLKTGDYKITLGESEIPYAYSTLTYLHVPEGFTPDVTVTINGQEYTATASDNYCINITNLRLGENKVTINCTGNYVYGPFSSNETFTSNSDILASDYMKTEWNSSDMIGYMLLPNDATGKLSLIDAESGAELLSANPKDRKAEILADDLKIGKYTAYLKYEDESYTTQSNIIQIEIYPKIIVPEYAYREGDSSIALKAPSDSAGTLYAYYVKEHREGDDGNYYPVYELIGECAVENGAAEVDLMDLDNGFNAIHVEYVQDGYNYTTDMYSYIVKVILNIENNSEITKETNSGVYSNLYQYIEGTITFYFDEEQKESYSTTGSETYFSFDNCDLSNGNHTLEVNFINDNVNTSTKIAFTVVEIKIDIPKEIAKNDEMDNWAHVYTPSNATGNITVYVDGEYFTYEELNNYNHYSLLLNGLDVGYHDIEVVYSGDENYNRTSKTERVHVDYQLNIVKYELRYGKDDLKICLEDYTDVTIKIDGAEVEYIMDGHYAIISHDKLSLDTHDVIVADENGDELINGHVRVYGDIIYENYQFEILLPEDANGTLEININKYNPVNGEYEKYTVEEIHVVNGIATYSTKELTPDNYQFIAEYDGSDYESNKIYIYENGDYKFFTDDDEIMAGENTTAHIMTNDKVSGNFTVSIYAEGPYGYEEYMILDPVEISNNNAEIVISGLSKGKYILKLKINGIYDGAELNAEEQFLLTVKPLTTELTAETEDIFEGETAIVNVTLPSDVTGNIIVRLDGEELYTVAASEKLSFEFENLKAGIHGVEIIFSDDPNYADNSTFIGFIVNEVVPEPVDSQMNMTIDENTEVGKNPVAKIELPEDATGKITIKMDGKVIDEFDVENSQIEVELKDLKVGEYFIEATYSGDEKYASKTEGKDISISRITTEIKAEDKEITEGESVDITVELPEKATGIVLVKIGENKYFAEISQGKATVTVDGLTADTYTAAITYNGAENYTEASATATVKVNPVEEPIQAEPQITVPDDIKPGDDETITIKLPENATGNVTVKVDGKEIANKELENGKANINIDAIKAGEHIIEVTYTGDENYTSAAKTQTLTIEKTTPNITAENVEIKEGETANIQINIDNDATGIILVDIAGNKYYGEINKGKATVTVEDLSAETHTATITYNGNDKYTNASATATVKVEAIPEPENPAVNVEIPENMKPGENTNINIELPENATGNVTVKVDGKEIANKELENGKANINVDALNAGEHVIEVTYTGDENYAPASDAKEFTVSKVKTHIKAEAGEVTEGDTVIITVTVSEESALQGRPLKLSLLAANNPSSSATGIVLVDLDGSKYYADVSDGEATVTISNLKAGEYTAEILYLGDDKYNESMGTISFNVKAAEAPVTPEANVSIPKDAKDITVALPKDATGNVTVKVDGKEIATVPLENGTAKIPLDLTPGEHTIEATYTGDDKYTPATQTKEITKEKQTTTIKTENTEIKEGETANIQIEITNGTTGVILADIDGNKFYGDITNGKATVIVQGLSAGNHTAKITYNGDDKYTNASATATITVKAIEPTPEPIAPQANITVPEDAKNITVALPEDATGNVTVKVDGKEIATVPLENGTAKIPLDLTPGEHTIEATYTGDDKYTPATQTKEIIKEKQTTTIKTENTEIKEGETANIQIEITNGATGVILIDIAGNKYYGEISSGKATVIVQGLSAGNHTAKITYNGDDKYTNASATATVSVSAKSVEPTPEPVTPEANITVPSEIKSGESATAEVSLPKDATGNVSVKVNGEEIANVELTNGSASVPITNLNKGANLVEVAYSGDDKYAPVSNSAAINKAKQDTVLKVDSKFSRVANDFNAGERGDYFYAVLTDASGKLLVNKTVQVAINGPIYNVTTDDKGQAGVKVNLANANVYTYALEFQGDEDYNAAPLASSKLTLTAKKTSITAKDASFKKSAKTKTVSVTLKTTKNPYDGKTYLSAGKKLTLKVDGKTFTAKINDKGVAKFNVKLNKKGKYTAKISFSGDKTYAASSKSIKINIK